MALFLGRGMIPSPYDFSKNGMNPQPLTPNEMAELGRWLEVLKGHLNFSQAMLYVKTLKKHSPCENEDCDHFEKVLLNLQFNKADLEELSDNIRNFLL